MVNFTINKKQYQFPSTWGDITIKEAVGLHQLCKSIPTKLKEKYDLILASKDHDQAEEDRVRDQRGRRSRPSVARPH